MKKKALVLAVETETLTIAVNGNDDASGPVAACCIVPSQKLDVKNPWGVSVQPGEEVWMTDGLGAMVGAGLLFVIIPVVLYGIGSVIWALPGGLVGVAIGLVLGYFFLRSQHLGQYPKVLARIPSTDGSA
ncbi:MAG: hypothetical protein HKM05_09430 [Spirochaetales bacterium]|nr:hypothetical protein [Spirochaetales bacterium]